MSEHFSNEPPADPGTLTEWVTVRATIPLRGKPRDSLWLVDPDDPEVQGLLGAGWLIPVGEPDELPAGE